MAKVISKFLKKEQLNSSISEKKSGNFSHINYAIVADTHSPMYLMHKYWARKPYNVVREYIEHYSKEGDIVLDPFCGSGVTVIEALKAGRRAVAVDLNPIATLVTKMTVIPVDLKKFEEAFELIKNAVKEKIDSFYEIRCPDCNENAITNSVVWSYTVECPSCKKEITMSKAERPKGKRQNIYICYHCKRTFSYANQKILNEVPIILSFICSKCGKKGIIENPKINSKIDLSSYWYPKISLRYPNNKPFLTKRRSGTIEELFTSRNIASLSILLDAIDSIKESVYRDLMKFVFSSMLPQASRMMIWTKKSGPSWKMPEYLIFPLHQELNVWDRFENRYKSVYRGKEYSNKEIEYFKEGLKFDDLRGTCNFLILNKNALELTKGKDAIPEGKIDYVFTDPPYGGDMQYFELDFIRAAWLRGKNEDKRYNLDWWEDEITINKTGQGKDFDYYHKMISAAFEQIYKVLKKGAWLTVTFHNTDVKTYTSILLAGVLNGFTTEKVVYQPPSVVSVKAQAQPYGSAVGDYYIRFRKPLKNGKQTFPSYDVERYERAVVETAIDFIAARNQPTPLTHLLTMYSKLGDKGVLLGAKESIDDVLKKHLNKEFVIVDNKWWLKTPEKYLLQITPLDERIETVIVDTLNRHVKVAFEDIVKEIYIQFQNSHTPDQNIKSTLEEYAEKTPDKKWRLKPLVKERVREHSVMIGILAELGQKFGFDIHVGKREENDIYENKPLGNFSAKNLPPLSEREKEIDLLWIKDSNIKYSFEVEYTTGITDAIIRGSYIKADDVKRFFIIPEEKENKLHRKIEAPILKDRIEKYNWKFIFFKDLKGFYENNKKKKIISIMDFEKIQKLLIIKKEIQKTLKVK